MKKNFLLILALGLFLSCSSSGPKKTAQAFVDNLAQGKVEEAKKYATEATGQLLDMANALGGIEVKPDFEFTFLRDSVADNSAWVYFADEEGKEDVIELIKVDGKWLVHADAKK
jgi:anionic cell wall polymer biosynthesis LytR-Cps2A-Psr (LCP) family protein